MYGIEGPEEIEIPSYEPRVVVIPAECETLIGRAAARGMTDFTEREARMVDFCQQQQIIRSAEEEAAAKRLDAHARAALDHLRSRYPTLPYALAEGLPFLSEGMATYFAMQAVKESRGGEQFRRLMAFLREPYPFRPIRRGEPLLRALDPYLAPVAGKIPIIVSGISMSSVDSAFTSGVTSTLSIE